jgi:broad specificity phosphatase PhoE
MILYCVRHGETVANAAGRIQGQSDTCLSPLGQRQSQAVAAALGELPIEAVYASPLRRAVDSAQCVADRLHLGMRVDGRLMEINAGIFQGLSWPQIEARYPREARRWKAQDPDFRIPGGESRRDVMRRADEALREIHAAGHTQAIIVAHGGLLSAAFKVLLNIPAERNPFSLENGSISKIAWDRDVKLLWLNQTHHLQGAHGGDGEL